MGKAPTRQEEIGSSGQNAQGNQILYGDKVPLTEVRHSPLSTPLSGNFFWPVAEFARIQIGERF